MKPVIKKQTFYSMLLMRDDSEVRSFRVKNTTLRIGVGLLAIFMLLGAVGIGVGTHYWKRYASIIDEFRRNERELAEARLQLQQLGGMEKIANAGSCPIPQMKNNEVGAEAPPRKQNATLPVAISGLSPSGSGERTTNATQGMFNATGLASSGIPPLQGTGLERVEGSLPPSPASAPAKQPPISGPKSPLRINNYSGRAVTQQQVRVRYELSTTPEVQAQISGNARYIAVFKNGTRLTMESEKNNDAAFSIRSLKPMSDTLRLPEGFSTRQMKSLDISLELEDGQKFQETYLITR